MDSIRKLVSERLRAPSHAPHPDADVLSAFLENSLPRAQRKQVLAHLSNCQDCREVLYLSLPESDKAQTVLTLHRDRTRLFRLRWATVIAGVGIAAAILTARYQLLNTRNQPSMATFQQPVSTYAKVKADNASSEKDRTRAPVAEKKAEARVSKAMPEFKAMHAKPAASLDFDQSGQVHMRAPAPGAAQAVPPSPEAANAALPGTFVVSSQEDSKRLSLSDQNATNRIDALESKQTSAPSAGPLHVAAASSSLGEREEARSVTVIDGTVKTSFQPGLIRFPAGTSRLEWTLSGEGNVLRSSDNGKTWQAVPAPNSGRFAALSSVGTHVWIGGKGGTLYHSVDSGQSWHEVLPAQEDRKLTSDITHIEFSDPQNGIVTTRDGESWTTTDGGLSWHHK